MCLLGAGNINDVELSRLLPTDAHSGLRGFSHLALVDLDARAMQNGLARQMSHYSLDRRVQPLVKLYSADVSSSYDAWTEWKRAHELNAALTRRGRGELTPSVDEVDAWRRALHTSPRRLTRSKGMPRLDEAGRTTRYDVVASVCLLSQLVNTFTDVVEKQHPSYLAGVLALRESHFSLMLDLLEPGGWGLLVTDIVATTTLPQLRDLTHAELPALLPNLVESGNFFTGTNPQAIANSLASKFADEIVRGSISVLTPWKWTMGGTENKQFLVYGIRFRRALNAAHNEADATYADEDDLTVEVDV